MSSRRDFIRGAALSVMGLLAAKKKSEAQQTQPQTKSGSDPGGVVAVEFPDTPKLPWKWEKGARTFRLTAEVVRQELVPGKWLHAWGYNGSIPGPAIEATEGDRVRIIVENKLPEPTSMHWHGLEVPMNMDGVPAISQPLIMPGQTFVYEFTLHQKGTFFYHSHMPMQEMMGMIGFFIIHPLEPYLPRVDRDFGIILQEWALLPNNPVPNTSAMEFNWLTLNGKAGPASTPLIVKRGERVRIRFVNLGMDHHPMHLHGNTFHVTGTEGGRIPEVAWMPGNTVLVGVAQAREIEFDAKYAGEWMLHCHLPHHMMNQMVSMVGPMSHWGHGMKAGMGMEQGMGTMEGQALSDENGPSLGRSMGVGTTQEESTTHLVGQDTQGLVSAAKKVPGYPQDMWMTMDKEVAKPETHGLPEGWTGSMMGMMTLVRVLEPSLYAKVRSLQARSRRPATEEDSIHAK